MKKNYVKKIDLKRKHRSINPILIFWQHTKVNLIEVFRLLSFISRFKTDKNEQINIHHETRQILVSLLSALYHLGIWIWGIGTIKWLGMLKDSTRDHIGTKCDNCTFLSTTNFFNENMRNNLLLNTFHFQQNCHCTKRDKIVYWNTSLKS